MSRHSWSDGLAAVTDLSRPKRPSPDPRLRDLGSKLDLEDYIFCLTLIPPWHLNDGSLTRVNESPHYRCSLLWFQAAPTTIEFQLKDVGEISQKRHATAQRAPGPADAFSCRNSAANGEEERRRERGYGG